MFNVILYQPEIPPNSGNIIRLCANTGAQLHLIRPLGFDLDDKQLRRAGLDYHEYASVRVHDDLPACLQTLPRRALQPDNQSEDGCTARLPHPNPDEATGETTSHLAKLQNPQQAIGYSHSARTAKNAVQVAGYPTKGEGQNVSLRELIDSRRAFAFTTKGAQAYHETRYLAGDALLFGPESRGLPAEILAQFGPEQRLRLPMLPHSRSLNLSNTVAVAVFEAWRQCGFVGREAGGE